uniref:Polyprotein n=1 Tax=Solanum tuberosum TaxID=4113 RepID=M1BF90_SOLTU
MKGKMILFVFGLSRLSIKEGKTAILIGNMAITELLIHMQQDEEDKLKDRDNFYNKMDRPKNNETGQQKAGNRNDLFSRGHLGLLHLQLVYLHQEIGMITGIRVFRSSELGVLSLVSR